MKGDAKVIEALNKALTVELTAVNQYFIQARMCDNWGYKKLGKKHYEESIEEMKHADKIIARILMLDGTPEIARYDVIRAGKDVPSQFEADLKLELKGVQTYRAGIDVCLKASDAASREVMEHILVDSEEHVDWLETQLGVIKAIGLENYLSEQL